MPRACGCEWPCYILKILHIFSIFTQITAKNLRFTTKFTAVLFITLIASPNIDAAWPVVPFGGLKGPDELGTAFNMYSNVTVETKTFLIEKAILDSPN